MSYVSVYGRWYFLQNPIWPIKYCWSYVFIDVCLEFKNSGLFTDLNRDFFSALQLNFVSVYNNALLIELTWIGNQLAQITQITLLETASGIRIVNNIIHFFVSIFKWIFHYLRYILLNCLYGRQYKACNRSR